MPTEQKSNKPKDSLLLAGSIRSIFTSEKELPYTAKSFIASCVVVAIGSKLENPKIIFRLQKDKEIISDSLAIAHYKKINGIEKIDVYTNGGYIINIDPELQTIYAHSPSNHYGQASYDEFTEILQNIFPDYAIKVKPGSYKSSDFDMRKSGIIYRD